MGFEMPGNDDSWYACLVEQDHCIGILTVKVYWLYPLDLCKALGVYYLSSSFQGSPLKLF